MEDVDQLRKGTTVMIILNLLVEADEPLHGYAITHRLEEASEGLFRFGEGLVYPTLHRMEREGLLVSRWVDDPGSRRRKVYTVTSRGRDRLARDVRRWRELSGGMNRLLGLESA
jgi:DNA-binding PadR family transcriptional regulator